MSGMVVGVGDWSTVVGGAVVAGAVVEGAVVLDAVVGGAVVGATVDDEVVGAVVLVVVDVVEVLVVDEVVVVVQSSGLAGISAGSKDFSTAPALNTQSVNCGTCANTSSGMVVVEPLPAGMVILGPPPPRVTTMSSFG